MNGLQLRVELINLSIGLKMPEQRYALEKKPDQPVVAVADWERSLVLGGGPVVESALFLFTMARP
jgi:hypothetical protein